MAAIIEMPKLSDTMTVGTLVSWLKNEGDSVAVGDMIAEVETDKATMELEAFDEGILLKQMVKAGEQVAVGTPICAIGEKGDKVDAPKSQKPEAAAQEDHKKDEKADQKAQAKTEPSPQKQEQEAKEESPAKATEPAPAPSADSSSGKRVKVSPLARRLAEEKGVSLENVSGTGPGGRIVKADILTAAAKGSSQPATRSDAKGAPPAAPAFTGGATPIAEEKTITLSGMRETIARRLLESKTQIPHFYLEVEIDAEPLLNIRQAVNAALAELPPEKGGAKLSVNDFVLKACAEALRRVPSVNASWQGNKIQQHPSAHVSFAVAIDEGLITPVIRDAQGKSVRQISAEVKDLAWKAKNKKLKPDQFTGGTFCVSNMGMYGIERFNAIINPPNAAILAVGATRKLPVVNKRDEIVIGHRMSLVLSCDHRVVDGAIGAQFLNALRELLETPALMLV
jgi:pyruvate dehydrogenase E2 component (dihydrolipoamide acetyltransferase)